MNLSKNVIVKKEQKILTLENLEEILTLEMQNLSFSIQDEVQRSMASWNAKWRKESLEFYLPKGWSFGIFEKEDSANANPQGELKGYFLGQPLVFFRGQTQTLWVEHVFAKDVETKSELLQLAYGYAKDKHFQRLLLAEDFGLGPILQNYKANKLQDHVTEVNIR